MCPSPHYWTIPSFHTPPLPMATQPPLLTTSNPSVQIQIPVPSLQSYLSSLLLCDLLPCWLQFFDSTDFVYWTEQFHNGIEARNVCQLAPEPTSLDHKHIWHKHPMDLVATSLDSAPPFGLLVLSKLTHKTDLIQQLISLTNSIELQHKISLNRSSIGTIKL